MAIWNSYVTHYQRVSLQSLAHLGYHRPRKPDWIPHISALGLRRMPFIAGGPIFGGSKNRGIPRRLGFNTSPNQEDVVVCRKHRHGTSEHPAFFLYPLVVTNIAMENGP
jgi:hypothetical protein